MNNKPKITSAVYKENGARLMHGYSIDQDGNILLSDIQAKELALERKNKKQDNNVDIEKIQCDGTNKKNSLVQDVNEQNGYEVA